MWYILIPFTERFGFVGLGSVCRKLLCRRESVLKAKFRSPRVWVFVCIRISLVRRDNKVCWKSSSLEAFKERHNPWFKMRDQPCGTYSVKSHCFQLLRYHKHDWLMIVGLLITEIVLNVIHPFRRFVGKDMMTDLRYPLKSNTVPVWSVPLYAVLLPILIFVIYYFRKRNVNDLHHAVLGLLFAVFITGVITDAIKDGVGRPRPDFFWRCFPDGKDLYDNVTTNVICHGDPAVIKEGHKSFPSAHTSWSFAGLGYLSLYLAGKIKIFDRRGHAAKLCIVCFPLLAAAMVGVSRVDDYWHHWQDVFAGALIGLIMATLCYRQFFPAPYDSEGFGPYSYFQIITDALVPEMDNANGQQNSAQDSQSELPHFTMNGERAIETRNMEQAIEIRNMEQAIEIRNIQGRGDRPLFDIETARSRELVVENGPSEAFIGRKTSTVKRNPFEESMERKGSNGKENPFDVIVERRGTLGKGNPFDVK